MPFEPLFDKITNQFTAEDFSFDESAFEKLFREFFTPLCAYCQFKYDFDLDLSKEAVHTSFIKLWDKREGVSQNLSVKAYLYKIVNNTCLDIIKHRKIKLRHESYILRNSSEYSTSNEPDSADVKSLKEAVDHAVDQLPGQMRKIFILNRFEGLKYAQIASLLNISVKTVETQMSRALVKLRAKLMIYTSFCSLFVLLLG